MARKTKVVKTEVVKACSMNNFVEFHSADEEDTLLLRLVGRGVVFQVDGCPLITIPDLRRVVTLTLRMKSEASLSGAEIDIDLGEGACRNFQIYMPDVEKVFYWLNWAVARVQGDADMVEHFVRWFHDVPPGEENDR